MFIHWGLYAIPAGIWNGREVPFPSEWIMKNARIPNAEYTKLAGKFNPVSYNAGEWARLAKDAGMKYLVITAKHHDGFAMYDSKCSTYDIVDVTPYKKDPMKELAAACEKEGIVFCFYYSQLQDWHHPDAVGNDWDFPDTEKKCFERYIEEKVKPQLEELLTGYGPIGIIWFDTPYEMPRKYCEQLVDFIHSIQPDCIINGRIGYGLGDYRQMGDNSIPVLGYCCPDSNRRFIYCFSYHMYGLYSVKSVECARKVTFYSTLHIPRYSKLHFQQAYSEECGCLLP